MNKFIDNFDEVVSTYTKEEALKEAKRCLQCKNPVCISGCPVGIDIKTFIRQIAQGDYKAAYLTIKEKNNFPSICGRVCPAEYQCRKACVMTKKGEPFCSEKSIGIHFLERFAGDWGMKNSPHPCPLPIGARVKGEGEEDAVGSGPAGLCCAGELARRGVKVVVFEGLHKPGGVLRYGIPPFRLPNDILDFEIDSLKGIGVEIVTNFIIGRTKLLDELFSDGFKAVFLGLGAGMPSFLGVKGENLCNIYSANEFLVRTNLMSAYKFPRYHTPVNIGRRVVVIGGGNTAMDAARSALRLQKLNRIKPDTAIMYRRTEIDMPARRLEIEHAKEEGLKFEFLVKPEEFSGDDKGNVKQLRGLRCSLGEPDASGRPRPVPIKGSDFNAECDMAVIAVGLRANTILTSVTPGLKTGKYGDLIVDDSMKTSIDGVYAGGDIIGGEGTVIEAMGMAKKAASSIIRSLKK